MTQSTKYNVPEHVVVRALGAELVLLDLKQGTYFGLDEVGALIWNGIEEGLGVDEICEAVISNYEVTKDVAEKDLEALLQQLLDASIIQTN